MQSYVKISLLLCTFGFLKELRPSESYIYEYFTGPDHNFTSEETEQWILATGVYGTLIALVFVFFLTDICRYKPMIVVSGISAIITWCMYIWCESLLAMVLSNLFFGLFVAAEVAYFSYIYAKVDTKHYQKVSSYTRGAVLAGRCLSGAIAQIFVSTRSDASLEGLTYISLASLSLGTIVSLFLPTVETSLYFNPKDTQGLKFCAKVRNAFQLMKSHFWDACTNCYIVKWSIWWALSTGGVIQLEYYIQPLYSTIQGSDEESYNGAVEAIRTFLGFLAALAAGYVETSWEVKGELILGLFSLFQGALVVVASQTNLIFLCYALYILFTILYNFMITIASAEIARNIDEDSYGLIFGINQFLAQSFSSILTAAVATEEVGLGLKSREQFVVYGSYHIAIALVFICLGILTYLRNK